MSYDDIITFFYTLVDDEPDTEFLAVLADTAYTKRNESRIWSFLMKLDTSITHSPGDTWATEKTLPTDFSSPYKLYGGASDNEYLPVPFDRILQYKSVGNHYTLDMANLKMRLSGAPSAALTMYLWYQYAPTSLVGLTTDQKSAAGTSSPIAWPARFRPILAYDMAEAYLGGVDADDITRKMAPYQQKLYRTLELAMIKWNARILTRLMDNSASGERVHRGTSADVVDW